MDWIQRIMNQTSSPSMKELLLRHCSILGSSIRICQRHTATGLELGTSKVQRYCGANEEFGGDVRRYDMTCISYGLHKIVHDTWHMVLLWIRCVMIWVGLCEITLWSKIKCAEHHSLARQVFWLQRGCQHPAKFAIDSTMSRPSRKCSHWRPQRAGVWRHGASEVEVVVPIPLGTRSVMSFSLKPAAKKWINGPFLWFE